MEEVCGTTANADLLNETEGFCRLLNKYQNLMFLFLLSSIIVMTGKDVYGIWTVCS